MADDVGDLVGNCQMVRHLQPVLVDGSAAAEAARTHGARAAFRATEVPFPVFAAGPAGGDVLDVVRRAAADAEAGRRGADLRLAP